MWRPPANTIDDEPSEYGKETMMENVKRHTFDSKSAVAIVENQAVGEFVTSKEQKEEISSSHSYSSATISSLTKTSQSESFIQSKQMMQKTSTGTVKSFSQKSSESQSSTVYQSQANIQSINQDKIELEDVNKVQITGTKENIQSQTATDVKRANKLEMNNEFISKEVQESKKIDQSEVKQNQLFNLKQEMLYLNKTQTKLIVKGST